MQALQPLVTSQLEAQLFDLGERLSLARRRRRIPQRELARHVGVTVVTLRKLERGHGGVSLATLVKALAAVGLGEHVDLLAANDRHGRKLQDWAQIGPPRGCQFGLRAKEARVRTRNLDL
jgi:transcriptional regulator with XRE-family HTH domain